MVVNKATDVTGGLAMNGFLSEQQHLIWSDTEFVVHFGVFFVKASVL